ncbi:MAG: VOC family protein [SAR202 cluster bacterium]|nr:VOC family protein [SAR202 cluster bacterium]
MTEKTQSIGQLNGIIIDVRDLDKAEVFWAVVLGTEVAFKDSQYVVFQNQIEGSPRIGLQKATEVKNSKNRMHLDFSVPNVEVASEKIVSAGGSRLRKFDEQGFIVMADPDGNEFCVTPSRG